MVSSKLNLSPEMAFCAEIHSWCALIKLSRGILQHAAMPATECFRALLMRPQFEFNPNVFVPSRSFQRVSHLITSSLVRLFDRV